MGPTNWWNQRRFGLLVHTSAASVPGWAPVGQYASWYQAHVDDSASDVLLHPSPLVETLAHHRDRWAHIEHPDDFLPFLTFDEFDADAWASIAREAGMGYAVMVAKHHDGLCWWDAPGTAHTVLNEGPRRNVLGDFAAACERAQLPFGVQYSLLDWHDERYPSCSYVDDVVHPQVLDLVDRYGAKMLWGDGHWGKGASHWRSAELIAAARARDPEIVINDRWWADEASVTSYEYRLPDAVQREPWEHRRGIGRGFGKNRAEPAEHRMSAIDIVGLLTEVVAKGGHLLLSVSPDAQGSIGDDDLERLRAAGGWVRRHERLINDGQPWHTWGDSDCRYLTLDGSLYAIDVGGRGKFAAIDAANFPVASVTTNDGTEIAFEQRDGGLRLERPPRRTQRLPVAYHIELADTPEAPIELFAATPTPPIELAPLLAEAKPGAIVQLGDGTYVGPARIPDGVTVRGLGPTRTAIDGIESVAVVIGTASRLEHCTVRGNGDRIVWLPKPVVSMPNDRATMLGCRVDGHIEVSGSAVKITSCHTWGVVGRDMDQLSINRSTVVGMNWDCGIDITGGSGHIVDACEISDVLQAIRLTGTQGAEVRGNRLRARWWAVQLIDTEGTHVFGNAVADAMRAVDVDGGTLSQIMSNAVQDGDSGCLVQRGASDIEVSGNRWERCRIGLMTWDAGVVRHHDNDCADLGEPDGEVVNGP